MYLFIVRQQFRQHAGGENITVRYAYNPVNEVTTVTHPNGRETKYEYDQLGRKLMVSHPDAGETDMTYDTAGNLLTKLTAQLRKSISDKGCITYTYDYERLKEVLYPENLFNRVTYTYGQPGDKYGRAGRLALVEDASGGEAYYYGRQGEVTKTVRTVMASVADIRTYVYGATYDSWNRVRTMTYPDGEVVTYHYNAAGQVESLTSSKQGKESSIVAQIGYDKDGHTVYQKLGNGTETTYTYDKQRERLQNMTLTGSGSTLMQNKYRYDAVDNILGITNAANPQGLTKLNKAKLGGASTHTYQYDELNRLIHATGKAKSATYDMAMTFGRMSEPLTKVQRVDPSLTAKSYNFAYKYEDENHPTAPTQIGHDHYTYDANGNPTLVTNDSTNTTREMYWDEDNRLMVLSDNGKTSRYTYNAGGERIMKSYGTMEGVYINGAPQGITFHETDNFTLYPAPIISINKNRFTKHYFIGSQRIASRIGTGTFNNVYGINGSYVTAGLQDYAERMNQIQSQKEAYYKELGIAPGVPTEKGAYGDPENTGVGYNSVLTELGNHDVPQGWVQTPKHNDEQGSTPGTPISWNEPSNPDDPQAGYGYIANDTTTEEIFFFHSDHLGSTSYITDDKGNITQYDAYLPYGELLVDEHSSTEEMPYKFNGKEMDEETGLYYYGARYMNPITSLWYGVDQISFTKPMLLSYAYCSDNPVRYYDQNGKIGIDGVIIGGIAGGASEYLSIMFQKMDNLSLKSFLKANNSLTWRDGLSIVYNIGTGAVSGALDNGISTMVKIVRNPVAKWVLKEGIGMILDGVESAISKIITGKNINIKAIVAQTLIGKGFGHILPISYVKKATIGARQNYQRALKVLKDDQSRRSPNAKLVSKALAELNEAKLNYGLLSGFLTGLKTTHKQMTRKTVEQLPKEYGGK